MILQRQQTRAHAQNPKLNRCRRCFQREKPPRALGEGLRPLQEAVRQGAERGAGAEDRLGSSAGGETGQSGSEQQLLGRWLGLTLSSVGQKRLRADGYGPKRSDVEKQMAAHNILHQEIEAYGSQLQPGTVPAKVAAAPRRR